MKQVSLSGSARENVGKKDAKALRASGQVPGVIYGNGENISFSVKETDLNKILWSNDVYFVNIDVNGSTYKTVVQEAQYHPVTDRVIHIDLRVVTEDKAITVALPIRTSGTSPGVQQGGKLRINKRSIKVNGLAKAFPEAVTIDLTPLKIGASVRTGDVDIEGLTIVGDPRDVLVSVKMARGAVVEEEEEGAEADAEAATEA